MKCKLWGLIIIIGGGLLFGFPAAPAHAQGFYCITDTPANATMWAAAVGIFQTAGSSPYGVEGFHAVGVDIHSENVRIVRNYQYNKIVRIDFRVYFTAKTEIPVRFEFTPMVGYVPRSQFVVQQASYQLYEWNSYTQQFPGVDSTELQVDIVQTSSIPDTAQAFVVIVDRVCFQTPSNEATRTPTPPTQTRTPTATSQYTPPPTNTPRPTTTLTPSLTRTPNPLTPTKTPSPSPGAGTPTALPQNTLEPLVSGHFPTPSPQSSDLRFPFPVPRLPNPGMVAPSAIPARTTATAALATAFRGDVSGVALIPVEGALTSVAQYSGAVKAWSTQVFLDAQGTPMADLRNQANQIGGNIGGFFYVLRTMRESIGQTGDLVVILLIVIGFNILVRIIVFVISFVFFMWRALMVLIRLVSQSPGAAVFLIALIFVIVILIAASATPGNFSEATPVALATRTPTGTITLTVTTTLLPIVPTATSRFIGFRPTPTALTLATVPFVVGDAFDGTSADYAINTYRTLNTMSGGLVDFIAFIALVAIALVVGVRLVRILNASK